MDALLADLRFCLRQLLGRPGTTAVAVGTLALGIGANTAIFSVVNPVLFRPLPYRDPGKLVAIWEDHARRDGPEREWPSPDNFFDWREQSASFASMAAVDGWSPTLAGVDRPERLSGARLSYGGLSLLGVEPALGRGLLPEDDAAGSPLVVLLGRDLWQRRFQASPDAVGASITLDGEPATVIGVLPAGVEIPFVGRPEIVAPLRIDRSNSCGRGCNTLHVVGRLAEGESLERVRVELSGVASRLERTYADVNAGVGTTVVSLKDELVGPSRARLYLLFAAVGLVLLIACANVASLTLARAADREREIATRIAMGASRARLVRQLLTESVLLSLAGGLLGLLLAVWGADVLAAAVRDTLPRVSSVGVDVDVLGFTLLVAGLSGIGFGLVPALRSSRGELRGTLEGGSRGSSASSSRLRAGLVVAEVALALTLLVVAGLLLRSLDRLTRVDPGFDPKGLLTAQVSLVGADYDDRTRRVDFVERVLERARGLGDVESAGVIFLLPLGGDAADTGFLIEGREPPPSGRNPVAWYRPVSPELFAAMRIPLRRGRGFRESDDAKAFPVVIVNETAVARYWAGEDPLQSRVRVAGAVRRVVGVVGDIKNFGLDAAERPAMYFPYAQLPSALVSFVLRVSTRPQSVAGPLTDIVREVDPSLAVTSVAPMRGVVEASVASPRATTALLAGFALLALLLAAIGLYGVLSYTVGQKRREIGIRMALGASASEVVVRSVGLGARLTLAGGTLGLVAALVSTRFLESLLFEVSVADPAAFGASALILAAVALAACYLPARRAARVDPVVSLRHE